MSSGKKAQYEKVVGSNDPADPMTKDADQTEIENHIEGMGACYPEGRAGGASKIATDEVKTSQDGGMKVMKEVVDRPGEADPACGVIAKPVGLRRQGCKDEGVDHFEFKKTGTDWPWSLTGKRSHSGRSVIKLMSGRWVLARGVSDPTQGIAHCPRSLGSWGGQAAGPGGFAGKHGPGTGGRSQEGAQRSVAEERGSQAEGPEANIL